MKCFPQLATGAVGQYPLCRTRRTRTVRNALADGRSIRLADTDAECTEWKLQFEELTDGELASLEGFFTAAEGCLNTFTFLDPAANLLSWSEDLDQAVWEKGPLASAAGGIADPLGTACAFRISNHGAAPQQIAQTLNVPAWYWYCLSMYARSGSAGEITLVQGDQRRRRRVGPQWSRLVLAAQPASVAESVRFGLELDAGTSVDVFGIQAEAQTGASLYRRTRGRNGVYESARFNQDEFKVTTQGPGRHSCVLSVIDGDHF
jgi:hypothetical protein